MEAAEDGVGARAVAPRNNETDSLCGVTFFAACHPRVPTPQRPKAFGFTARRFGGGTRGNLSTPLWSSIASCSSDQCRVCERALMLTAARKIKFTQQRMTLSSKLFMPPPVAASFMTTSPGFSQAATDYAKPYRRLQSLRRISLKTAVNLVRAAAASPSMMRIDCWRRRKMSSTTANMLKRLPRSETCSSGRQKVVALCEHWMWRSQA